MNSSLNPHLIQSAREGDAAALEELLRQHYPSLVNFARRYCIANDVEDAVQETLWTLTQKIGNLRNPQAFISWTFQIIRHHCYRLLSLQQNEDQRIALDQLDLLDVAEQEQTLQQELKQDVVQALAHLPSTYREILILRDIEDYTAPQVAAMLGITIETVKSRLHRGRALLRQSLAHWVQ